MAAAHHAAVVLLALLLALLPGKPADAPEEAEDADDQALGAHPTSSAAVTAVQKARVFRVSLTPKDPKAEIPVSAGACAGVLAESQALGASLEGAALLED